MRLLIQRVKQARVEVGGEIVGAIGNGLLILVGVSHLSTPGDARFLAGKASRLRVFDDVEGKMNRSLMDVGGRVLAVSQFTLYADTQKGNRPSYVQSAPAETARPLFEQFVQELKALGVETEIGIFQAEMEVSLVNHGPVTISLESEGRA